jgi:general secretion pathway protein F
MRYEIRALRAAQGVMALSLEASDAADATRQAERLGYTVLSVRARRAWARMVGRSARFPLVLFSQQLLALLDAGLTLVEALETLADKEARPELRQVYEGLIGRLREGHPLSFALAQYPQHFPELYTATVRASERTGGLSESLGRFVTYQTQIDIVRRKLVSASIYPALLIGVGGLVTVFLLTYVVPKFSRIYEDMGGALPLLSRLLLAWGRLVEAHTTALAVTALASCAALGYALSRAGVRRWLLERVWQLPALRAQMHVYQLARFYRTLGMLLRGGVPVLRATEMCAGLFAETRRAGLALAAEEVRQGQPMSRAFERHGLTTPVALRMLRVGERSGSMSEMMERIAVFYDDEIARWVDWFTRLIEPVLMAVIGLVIGSIVVLMYLPIFELAGSLQ